MVPETSTTWERHVYYTNSLNCLNFETRIPHQCLDFTTSKLSSVSFKIYISIFVLYFTQLCSACFRPRSKFRVNLISKINSASLKTQWSIFRLEIMRSMFQMQSHTHKRFKCSTQKVFSRTDKTRTTEFYACGVRRRDRGVIGALAGKWFRPEL